MFGDHVRVAAVLFAVLGGAAEDLAQPQGNVVRMIGRHVREHRAEDLVLEHMTAVEDLGESIEDRSAACPLVDRRRAICSH